MHYITFTSTTSFLFSDPPVHFLGRRVLAQHFFPSVFEVCLCAFHCTDNFLFILQTVDPRSLFVFSCLYFFAVVVAVLLIQSWICLMITLSSRPSSLFVQTAHWNFLSFSPCIIDPAHCLIFSPFLMHPWVEDYGHSALRVPPTSAFSSFISRQL